VLVLLLITALTLAFGCEKIEVEKVTISGTVVSSVGGPPVGGAKVALDGTIIYTTTDNDGYYSLRVPVGPPGTYDLIVTGSGSGRGVKRAVSKVQSVTVQRGKDMKINVVQLKALDPNAIPEAPTITVEGLAEGDTVSGIISLLVKVSSPNRMGKVMFYLNERTMAAPTLSERNDVGFMWDTRSEVNGPFKFTMVAFDLNNNRSELTLNINVDNPVYGAKPATPTEFASVGVTMGLELMWSGGKSKKDLEIIKLKDDEGALAAPEGSTLYIELGWDKIEGALGYRIYRSFSANGPFELIADTQGFMRYIPMAKGELGFYDTDPGLEVGKTTYYQLSAYNTAGESGRSETVSTTPLPPFNVLLKEPKNEATGVSLTPTFKWEPNAFVGDHQSYFIMVKGVNDDHYCWMAGIEDETEVMYNFDGKGEPLQSKKTCTWDILALAYTEDESGNTIAVALAGGGFFYGSLNGEFSFTTE